MPAARENQDATVEECHGSRQARKQVFATAQSPTQRVPGSRCSCQHRSACLCQNAPRLLAISLLSGENATESLPPFASIKTVRSFAKVLAFQISTPVPVSASLCQLPALANKLPSGEKATAFASLCPIKSCLSVSVFTFQIFSRPGPVLRSSSRSEAPKSTSKIAKRAAARGEHAAIGRKLERGNAPHRPRQRLPVLRGLLVREFRRAIVQQSQKRAGPRVIKLDLADAGSDSHDFAVGRKRESRHLEVGDSFRRPKHRIFIGRGER